MASRRSRRRKKKGGAGKSLFAIVLVLAIVGGGGWYLYQNNQSNSNEESSVADLVPDLKDDGSTNGPTVNDSDLMATLENEMAAIDDRLYTLEGVEREKAMIEDYTKLAKSLSGPIHSYDARSRMLVTFHALTDELFLGTNHNKFNSNYVVKGGDSFDKIARRHGCSMELIYRLNGKQSGSTSLHPGENLKVPLGKPKVVVRKRDFTTSVYLGDYMVRQYVVAHGKNNNTPVGKTSIISMTKHPEETALGPNDPVKEMKLRWVGLAPFGGNRSGIGFHGTQYPESIPGQTSRGCMRMHDGDVVELYDFIRIGNKVEVRA
ncbi:MAG: L,D-transpeptidase family protein [Planctomycetota bacterium]|jgi:LysM repeat protein